MAISQAKTGPSTPSLMLDARARAIYRRYGYDFFKPYLAQSFDSLNADSNNNYRLLDNEMDHAYAEVEYKISNIFVPSFLEQQVQAICYLVKYLLAPFISVICSIQLYM